MSRQLFRTATLSENVYTIPVALLRPHRLPRQFRRPVSRTSTSVASKSIHLQERRKRRRHEQFVRMKKRGQQLFTFIKAESYLWLFIALTVITCVTILALLISPYFNVREITVRRQDARIDPQEVQSLLSPLYREKLVLVTQAEVENLLTTSFPDITAVRIEKTYPSSLTVTLMLEPVVAAVRLVADETGTGSTKQGQYAYLTRNGVFYRVPIPITTEKLETFDIVDWGQEPQDRMEILSPILLQRALLARDILKRDFGLETVRIRLFIRAREFHISTPKLALWFDLRSELPVQFDRFRAFLRTLSLAQAKEYIDLRITDAVVYH